MREQDDTRICGGITGYQSTGWYEAERRPEDSHEKNVRGLRLLVNTSACFPGKAASSLQQGVPAYVASIKGSGHANEGAVYRFTHTLYEVTSTSFRLYLYNPTHWAKKKHDSEMQALLRQARRDWQVSWVAARGQRAGVTLTAATGWKQNLPHSLYVDVDTSKAGLNSSAPRYLVSVSSGNGHSRLIGGDALYAASKSSFRVYVLHELGAITPAEAESLGWVVSWIADTSEWSGTSNLHGWHEHKFKVGATNDPTPYAQVQFDKQAHQFKHTPIVITSGVGAGTYSWHVGCSVMYHTSTTGFRVYLDGIKASRLNGKLQVNYLAVDVKVDANGTHSVMVMPTEAPSQAPP